MSDIETIVNGYEAALRDSRQQIAALQAKADRDSARIADLEVAGRLLGAECRVMRNDYPDENWPHVTAVRNATDSHHTAAGFVKEATDGH